MAKKKTGRKVPMRTDLNSVEKDTIKRVNHTMAIIENFLAKWNASAIKPRDMLPQIDRIKRFHARLANWQKDAVKPHGKESEEARVRRLRDFVVICNTYS